MLVSEPILDVAHLGHVESIIPKIEASQAYVHTRGTPTLPDDAGSSHRLEWMQIVTAKTALEVSAHSADFGWRASGASTLHAPQDLAMAVIFLRFGVRGKFASLWRQSGVTLERVKTERRRKAAALAVAEVPFWDLGYSHFNLADDR